jgi:hypothetical protein
MPRFHLVVDEIVAVAHHRFRVQVWRRADCQPVVLLLQVPGHPPPDWFSSRVANLVLRSFLGYSLPLPVFFELSRWNGKPRAFRVSYESAGYHLRPILLHPTYEPINPEVIEQVFGRKLDTPN